MNESKIAVLKYESNRCDSHEVFLFESEGAGNDYQKILAPVCGEYD